MSRKSLVLVPSGGLANRMRAIVSAVHLCRTEGAPLRVVWFKDWGMQARFTDVFELPQVEGVTVNEASLWDYLLNDRPRQHNLYVSKWPQRWYYSGGVIAEQNITPLKQQGFDFHAWLRGRCYMSSYQVFGHFPISLYTEVLRPSAAVLRLTEQFVSDFTPYTVGMHIRRTDNQASIIKSPTSLFIEAGQRELAAHPQLRIFLATDSEQVKQEFRQVFGAERIVTSSSAATRSSCDGIRAGMADMLALARTQHIYGSAGSSFSEMASYISGHPEKLTILEKS